MKYPVELLFIVLGILCLTGCQANSPIGTVTPLVQETPILGNFQCWTEFISSGSLTKTTSEYLFVSLAQGENPLGLTDFYRYNPVSREYSLTVSNITEYGRHRPSPVSPDGRRLWYGTPIPKRPSEDAVSIYNLTDGTSELVNFPVSLYVPLSAISWSPDGQCLFLWHDDTAFAYRLSDGAIQKKTFQGVADFGIEVSPSPDGRWWAWGCSTGICLMSTSAQQTYRSDVGIPTEQPNEFPYHYGLFRWSPDSTMLAFTFAQKNPLAVNTVRLVRLVGNALTIYRDIDSSADEIYWSSDSRSLAIVPGFPRDKLVIFDVDADRSVEVPFFGKSSSIARPALSPSGRQIAVVGEDERTLFVSDLADGTKSEIPLPNSNDSDTHLTYVTWGW